MTRTSTPAPRRGRRLAHLGGQLALLLQLFVGAVLPLLDARSEIAASQQGAHVEETGQTGCVPTHDPGACEVCRALRAPFQASRIEPCGALITRSAGIDALRQAPDSGRAQYRVSGSRAPPRA